MACRVFYQGEKIFQSLRDRQFFPLLKSREFEKTKIFQVIQSRIEIDLALGRIEDHPGMLPCPPFKCRQYRFRRHQPCREFVVQVTIHFLQRSNQLIIESALFRQIKYCHIGILALFVLPEKTALPYMLQIFPLLPAEVAIGAAMGGPEDHLKQGTIIIENMDIGTMYRNIFEKDAFFLIIPLDLGGAEQTDVIAAHPYPACQGKIDIVLDGTFPADIHQGKSVF